MTFQDQPSMILLVPHYLGSLRSTCCSNSHPGTMISKPLIAAPTFVKSLAKANTRHDKALSCPEFVLHKFRHDKLQPRFQSPAAHQLFLRLLWTIQRQVVHSKYRKRRSIENRPSSSATNMLHEWRLGIWHAEEGSTWRMLRVPQNQRGTA